METPTPSIPKDFKDKIERKGIRHFFIRHIFHKVELEYETSRFTDDDITMGISLLTGRMNHSRRIMKPVLRTGGITVFISGSTAHVRIRYSNEEPEKDGVPGKPYESNGCFIAATNYSIYGIVSVFHRGSHLTPLAVMPAARGYRILYRAIVNGVLSKTYKFFMWTNYGEYTPYRIQREMHARLSFLIARDMEGDERKVFKNYKENKVKEIRLEENDPHTYLVTFVY